MADLTLYSGTSGLVLPVPNKQFYPEEFKTGTRLAYYSSLFNSIEVNSSFYKIPQASTVRKWVTEVPGNFRFTFKLWKGITHNKGLVADPRDVHKFMRVIINAGSKAGCLLIQLPPSLTYTHHIQLTGLLREIKAAEPSPTWQLAVEFRHPSWYREEVYDLLNTYQATLVLHDIPSSATPMKILDSEAVYIRFHGPGGNYRGSYPDDFLHEYATYIQEWIGERKTVYTYFNNTMGAAVNNLQSLTHFWRQAMDCNN